MHPTKVHEIFVLNAILGGYKPSPPPTPTPSTQTHTPPHLHLHLHTTTVLLYRGTLRSCSGSYKQPLLTCMTGGLAALSTLSSAASRRRVDLGRANRRAWHCSTRRRHNQLTKTPTHKREQTHYAAKACRARNHLAVVLRQTRVYICESGGEGGVDEGGGGGYAGSFVAVFAGLGSGKRGDA